MYRVMCDSYTLHNMTMPDLKLISPQVSLEVNKAGSFDFTIYPQHPYYKMINRLKSIIVVYQNDRIIFRGRALNVETGFNNQKKVSCEGELAFLLDSTIRPYDFTGDVSDYFAYIIGEHNKQVETAKQFKVGTVTVTDPNNYITRADSTYPTAYDCITKKLVESLGGYLRFRHESDGVYIDYLDDFTTVNTQNIELRKNILDLTDTVKGEEIATAIIPLGAKIKNEDGEETEERLTVASVNGGKDYVYDEDAVEKYGWIFKTVTYDDVTVATNLLRKGNEELAQAILSENTIEVNAVDLSGTDAEISAFSCGAYTRVKSDVHSIDGLMPITKMTINLTAPQNDTLTLGITTKTFTEQDKDNNDSMGDIVEKVETIIGDYQVNMPVIEEITKRLTLELTRNQPAIQSYSPQTGTYDPDYTVTPLEITPVTRYRNQVVTASCIWKMILDGEETALENGETVGSGGVLTINKNMADKYAVYICYATFSSGGTTLVANATIDLNRVDDGINGAPGAPGTPGTNGKTSYFHVKYSSVPNPESADQISEIPNVYIGTYVDYTEADSTDPKKYTWTKFRGDDGEDGADGIPGVNGEDGKTSYLHIAYANSADGSTGFSVSDSNNKTYIGQYTDFVESDSTDPTKYSWTKIKGENGIPGQNGQDGQDGEDGKTSYFHVKYSSVSNPTSYSQMSETPDTYIGTYVDFTQADSTDPSDYTWSRFQGYDGADGIPGTNGIDGKTSYLHIAYANSADGSVSFSTTDSTGRAYMGQYVDFAQADSTDYKKYTWSLIKGADGEDAAVASDTEPDDKTKLWLDTSMDPPLLKAWDGEKWIAVNDANDQIASLREELLSSITQESTNIRSEVAENYYLKDDADTLVQSINTQFEQTKNDFTFSFNEFRSDLDDLANGANAEFENIHKYIRFVDGKIVLGESGNELTLQIENDRISFQQNGAEVAYFTNNRFYVKDGEFTNSLTLGNFAFVPRSNGNLSFKKVR